MTISTEADLVKPELGTKRLCPTCGGRFYDLHKSPAECPYCGAVFNPEDLLRGRRNVRPAPEEVKVVEKKAPARDLEADEDLNDLEVADVNTDEDEEDEVLEDASDLGEDEEDVAEVMDNVERPDGGD